MNNALKVFIIVDQEKLRNWFGKFEFIFFCEISPVSRKNILFFMKVKSPITKIFVKKIKNVNNDNISMKSRNCISSIPGSSVRFPVKCGASAGSGESAGCIGSGGGVRAGTRSSGGRVPLSSSLDSLLKRIHSSNLRNKPNSSKTRHLCPAKEMILCN